MLPRPALFLVLAPLVFPAATFAQTTPADPNDTAPAHVAFVEGSVSLERDGAIERAPLNMPLSPGDRLKTDDGRVEVIFADGSLLYLDARTTVDVQSEEL